MKKLVYILFRLGNGALAMKRTTFKCLLTAGTVLVFITAGAFLLGFYINRPVPPPVTVGVDMPPELRKIVLQNQETALPPLRPDFREAAGRLLTPNLDMKEDLRIAALVKQNADLEITNFSHMGTAFPPPPPSGLINREDAAYDTGFFFDILRYGYTGYQYFGGDEVFLPIKDSVTERLSRMADPLPVSDYLNLLAGSLQDIIADNHFALHDVRFSAARQVPYTNEVFIVRKTESGFYTELYGETYRILKTTLQDGTPVESFMPSLTKEGEFAWVFGHLAEYDAHSRVRNIVAHLENAQTGESSSMDVLLMRINVPWHFDPRPPELRPLLETQEINGITVLENRSVQGNWQETSDMFESFTEFYESGRAMRDKPVLILDLRWHNGGQTQLVHEWITGYAGRQPNIEFALMPFSLGSFTEEELSEAYLPSVSDDSGLIIEHLPAWHARYDKWHENPERRTQWLLPEYPDGKILPNENLIIVLTDWSVSSAGEVFVAHLRQLENVLIVGTNTAGILVTGGAVRTSLPHSGLLVQLSIGNLNIRPDLSEFEGIGFMPDLWVPPRDSLERVLAFIEKYGIVE